VTIGGAPEDHSQLQRLRELGATRVNVTLLAAETAQVIFVLDR